MNNYRWAFVVSFSLSWLIFTVEGFNVTDPLLKAIYSLGASANCFFAWYFFDKIIKVKK
jgi:hypothetical protein